MGIDNIDALALKAATSQITAPIRHKVNTSLKTSKFASRWKLSKLLPLLKAKDLNRLLPASYRPIAILPAILKIVEKAAQSQILAHFEKFKLLNDGSHVYRKGYSTTTNLIDITDRLYQAIDERKISSLMTIDQSAAFDCVSHAILLRKMKVYRMDETVIK